LPSRRIHVTLPGATTAEWNQCRKALATAISINFPEKTRNEHKFLLSRFALHKGTQCGVEDGITHQQKLASEIDSDLVANITSRDILAARKFDDMEWLPYTFRYKHQTDKKNVEAVLAKTMSDLLSKFPTCVDTVVPVPTLETLSHFPRPDVASEIVSWIQEDHYGKTLVTVERDPFRRAAVDPTLFKHRLVDMVANSCEVYRIEPLVSVSDAATDRLVRAKTFLPRRISRRAEQSWTDDAIPPCHAKGKVLL
jgi:hypothetical protein